MNLGALDLDDGRLVDALAHSESATRRYESIIRERPDYDPAFSSMFHARHTLALALERLGRWDDAIRARRQMLVECEARAGRRPAEKSLAWQAGVELARLLARAGRPIEASARIAQPRSELETAAAQAVTNDQADLIQPLFQSGLALCEVGRAAEGRQVVFHAVDLCERVARLSPGQPRAAANLAALFLEVAQALGPHAPPEQLLPWADRAIDAYGSLPEKRDELAGALVEKANLLVQADRPADAIEPARRALSIRDSLANAAPDNLAAADRLAMTCIALAEAHRQAGNVSESLASYLRAAALLETARRAQPEVVLYARHLADAWLGEGAARRDAGDQATATATWRRALSLRENLPSQGAEDSCALAHIHASLATTSDPDLGARQHAAAAVAALRRAAATGFHEASALAEGPYLTPLRDRPDFRILLLDLAFPPDPFAPAH
jgi:tetratricopeptide (TPR) repeat protein